MASDPSSSSLLSRSWAALRQALAGSSEEDFTSGSLGRAIVLLAVPMVLEMAMESIFAVVDIFVIAFLADLGADAIATIGMTESVLTLVFAVAIGLSMATTATVARRIGEKDREGAAVTAVQAIGLAVVVSLFVGVAGILGARRILELMGGSTELVAAGSSYTAVLLGGSATVLLLFMSNAIFRGAGDAVIAMRVLTLANLINIILDPCLVLGLGPFPELGLAGAAVATTLGRGTGVVYQLVLLARGRGRIHLRRRHLRFDPAVTLRLLRVSVGGISQFLIATASWVGLVRILAVFGSVALAGYTLALRIIMFTILPAWGLSNAAATLVGQNLGARKPERAERSAWLTGFYNTVFLTLLGVSFVLFAEPIAGLFTRDPAIRAVAAVCLRIVGIGYPFYAYGMVMVQAFNGAGDTGTPTVINFFCYWMFQIPLAYLLARGTGLEHNGVFLAIVIAEAVLTVVSILVFRRGRWKQRQV